MAGHDERERAFLRELAEFLEVEEVTSEALAKSLGFDEFTPEKLDAWFITEVLGFGGEKAGAPKSAGAPEPAARVVQVEREEQPSAAPKRLALPAARRSKR